MPFERHIHSKQQLYLNAYVIKLRAKLTDKILIASYDYLLENQKNEILFVLHWLEKEKLN
jgi:hypothetical protein